MTKEVAQQYKEKLYDAFKEWRGYEEQYDFVFIVTQILTEILTDVEEEANETD